MSTKTTSAKRDSTTHEKVIRPDFTVFWRPTTTDARPVSLCSTVDSEGVTITRTLERAKK